MKNVRRIPRTYDVFGSYSERLLPRLKELSATTLAGGIRWFIHQRNGSPTIPWRAELDQQLLDCPLMVLIFDKDGLGNEQQNELATFLALKKPVIVLSLDPISTLKEHPQKLPPNVLIQTVIHVETPTSKETQSRLDCAIEAALRVEFSGNSCGPLDTPGAPTNSPLAPSGGMPLVNPASVKWMSSAVMVGTVMFGLQNADCSHHLTWHGGLKQTEQVKKAPLPKQAEPEKKEASSPQPEPKKRDKKDGKSDRNATTTSVKAEATRNRKPDGTSDPKTQAQSWQRESKLHVSSLTPMPDPCQTDNALKAIEGECLDSYE